MGAGTVEGGLSQATSRPLTKSDHSLCRQLAEVTEVSSDLVLKVTGSISESVKDLNWWEVKDVVRNHI